MQRIQRQQLKSRRRNLSRYTQQQAEKVIFNRIIRLAQFKHAKHIGIYLHAFGEIATHRIIMYGFKQQKNIYLPQISPINQRLNWVKISKHQYLNRRFSQHALGMYEPKQRAQPIQRLDLLILPLLACDHHGTRIGMGGGYYDRTLIQIPQRPYRLGIAHSFQFIHTSIKRQPWDQPLHGLLTPEKIQFF